MREEKATGRGLLEAITAPGQGVCLFACLFCFLGPHLQHMEVLRLGIKLELQLPAYARATATQDPSCIYDLHHSLWQCQIPNPLSEAMD